MVKERINLIPRYNWDFGSYDFVKALWANFKPDSECNTNFERAFGSKPIFTVSGRTSLYLILKSLGLPKGAGVGVPLFCCTVVFDAIRQAGLIPKFIDIDLENYGLSVTDVERKKRDLSAVIAVHMFGYPVDMDAIHAVATDIPVIEDCAQSLFSSYKGRITGSLGKASFFSFRSGKYISAGEGSVIFSDDVSLWHSIVKLVEELGTPSIFQGVAHNASTYIKSMLYKRPWYGTVGYPIGRLVDRRLNLTAKTGFKLSKITRGDLRIVCERIKTFHGKVTQQRENSLLYLDNLMMKDVALLYERDNCWSNYYQFPVRFETADKRDLAASYLFQKGIDTAKYLDEVVESAKCEYNYIGDCPNAEHSSKTVLIIPNHYNLSKRDLSHIVDTLNQIG
jgi:perosamine synthetase